MGTVWFPPVSYSDFLETKCVNKIAPKLPKGHRPSGVARFVYHELFAVFDWCSDPCSYTRDTLSSCGHMGSIPSRVLLGWNNPIWPICMQWCPSSGFSTHVMWPCARNVWLVASRTIPTSQLGLASQHVWNQEHFLNMETSTLVKPCKTIMNIHEL